MNIENCKRISDYLSLCNVKSIDDLTNDQVLAWAKSGKMGITTQVSADIVENGFFDEMPNMEKAILLLKQAMKEGKEFICAYIESESCEGPIESDEESFAMSIR